MTEITEISAVVEDAAQVAIDSGTPVTTIEDASGTVVVDPMGVEIASTDHTPEVYVRVGTGSLTDKDYILSLLEAAINNEHLHPDLLKDVTALHTLLLRAGNDVANILVQGDIQDIISQAADAVDIDALNARIASAEATIAGHSTDILSNTSAIASVNNWVTTHDPIIDSHAVDILGNQNDIATLNTTVGNLSTAVALTDGTLTLEADRINTLITRVDTAEGAIITNTASINIEADRIDSTVTRLTEAEESIIANAAQLTIEADRINTLVTEVATTSAGVLENAANITVEADRINSMVTRLNTTDAAVTSNTASIDIQADRITQEVTARTALENGQVTENASKITQTAESLALMVSSVDSIDNRLSQSEVNIDAHEVSIGVLESSMSGLDYTIQSALSLKADSFGVVIEENDQGESYATGFEVLMNPQWRADTPEQSVTYSTGDVVNYVDGKSYKALQNHTATDLNSPGSDQAAEYWEEYSSAKSEFNVAAESFKVMTPNGLVPLFSVTEGGVTFNSVIQPTESAVMFSWAGSEAIVTDGHIAIANSWNFDSIESGGVMIEIEVDDAFAGQLQVALNDSILTESDFGDWDFGNVDPTIANGFSDETSVEGYVDFSVGGKTYDLGGFN